MSKNSRRRLVGAVLAASLGMVGLASASAAIPVPGPDTPVGQCNITVLETRMSSPVLKSIFGTPLLEGFTASKFGTAWQAGEGVRENMLTPADITGLEDPEQRVATLALWAGMESLPEATSSVSEYYAEARASLNVLGRATFSDYDADSPVASKSLEVREVLSGTQSAESAVRSYDEAYRRLYHLKKAVVAAGYPDAEWENDSITLGDFDESSTDWKAFVKAYSNLSAANQGVASLPTPTLDLVHKVVAPDSVSGIAPKTHRSSGCYE